MGLTPELQHTMDKGYNFLIYEVRYWERQRASLLAEYINQLLKIKMEASGRPNSCDTELKKRAYVAKVYKCESIPLNSSEGNILEGELTEIMHKLLRKFDQRNNLTHTRFIRDSKNYFVMCLSKAVTLHDVTAVFPQCMMLALSSHDD